MRLSNMSRVPASDVTEIDPEESSQTPRNILYGHAASSVSLCAYKNQIITQHHPHHNKTCIKPLRLARPGRTLHLRQAAYTPTIPI